MSLTAKCIVKATSREAIDATVQRRVKAYRRSERKLDFLVWKDREHVQKIKACLADAKAGEAV